MKKIRHLIFLFIVFILSSVSVSDSFVNKKKESYFYRPLYQIGINDLKEIIAPYEKINNYDDWEFLNLQFEIDIPVLQDCNLVKVSKPHKVDVIFIDSFDRDTFIEVFSYEGENENIMLKVKHEVKRIAKENFWHWDSEKLSAPSEVKCYFLY